MQWSRRLFLEKRVNLDDTQRAFYGLIFENAFLREKGKAFETLFSRVMAHGFSEDFQPVRPYGSKGDMKCDGFRQSDGTVFQCYAPESTRACRHLSQTSAHTRCSPARKFRAVFS